MASRELKVEIIGDSRSLQKALGSAGDSATGFGSKFAKAGKVVGLAALGVGAAVAGGLVYTLKRGFDELGEAQKVMAQTEAVIKSTGGAANVTAKQVDDYAGSLSKMSGVDDEAIASGENMLLTFKNIRNETGKGNDIFKQSTATLLDMSTALGTDMNKSAIQLGKALNDPVKGITALTRVGVTFDAGQRKMIEGMVKAGDTMGAQKIILKELNSEFGGSAKAFGDTMPGQLAKLKNAFDEVAGEMATKFLPILTKIVEWVNAHWTQIAAVFDAVGTAIITSFNAIGVAVTYLRGQWEIHRESAMKAWAAVQDAVQRFIQFFQTQVVPAIQSVVNMAKAVWDHFGGEITAIGGRLVATVKQTFLNMVAPIRIILALLKGDWTEAWNIMKQVVTGTFGTMLGNIKATGGAIVSAAVDIGKGIVSGIVSGLASLAGKVAAAMGQLLGALANVAQVAYQFAYQIGSKIVGGIWDGFSSLIGGIKDKISSAIGGILSSIDIPGLSPPEHAAAETIGKPIAKGVLLGFLEGTVELPAKISERLRAVIEAGAAAVHAQESVLSAAFQQLAADAMTAFDAATTAGLAKIQTNLDAKLKQIGDRLSAALKLIGAAQAALTPAEKALADLDRGEVVRGLGRGLQQAQQALSDARSGVGFEAKEDETPEQAAARLARQNEAILAAQEQLRSAQLAIQRDSLTQQAAAERAAADKKAEQARIKAEKAAAAETLRAQKQAGNQALQYQAQRDLQQRHLERMLANLEQKLLEGDVKWQQAHKRIMLAFKDEFGPDMVTAGKNLGTAFGTGLTQSFGAVGGAADKLARLIAKYLKLKSPAELGPMADLDVWWDDLGPMLATSALRGLPAVQGAGMTLAGGLMPTEDDKKAIIGSWGEIAASFATPLDEGTAALGEFTAAEDETLASMRELGASVPTVFKNMAKNLNEIIPTVVAALQPLLDQFNKIIGALQAIIYYADKAGDVLGGGPMGGSGFQLPVGPPPDLKPSGMGMAYAPTFNFPNYVGDKRELTQAIQEAHGDWMRRNGSSMLG